MYHEISHNSIAIEHVLTHVYVIVITSEKELSTADCLSCGLQGGKDLHLDCDLETYNLAILQFSVRMIVLLPGL